MKLKYISIISFVFVLFLTACNDDFMQQDPIDNMAEGSYLTKEADLPIYLDGLYRYYVTGHGIGGTNSTAHDKGFLSVQAGSQILYNDQQSDNVVFAGTTKPFDRLTGRYDTPSSAPDAYVFDAPWNWTKLKKVNYFLDHYTDAGDAEDLKKWAAEAYFFKAWDYYLKVLALGEVPWLEHYLNVDSPELYAPRMSRDSLVNNIMDCFNFAIENLEDNAVPIGRINQDMALFLKAKFCLFEGTFRKYHTNIGLSGTADFFLKESRDAAKRIMDKNRYELYKGDGVKDAYWKLFTMKGTSGGSHKEAILARVYDNSGAKLGHDNPRYFGMNNHTRNPMGAPLGAIEDYLCEDGRPIYIGGSPGDYTENPLFKGYDGMWEELDNRDPRLRQTICKPGEYASVFDYNNGTYGIETTGIIYPMVTLTTGGGTPPKMYNSTVTGYRFIKHWMPDKEEWDNAAYGIHKGSQTALMFRYGELLLIYAETRAELNEITNEDLDNTINKLRERAGFDFAKWPNAKLSMGNIPNDPRLDAIYAEKLDYSVSPILREIRRERRVEMMLEGQRYEDLIRWKAGKLFTVPLRGMKITDEKKALYDGRVDKVNAATGYKETAVPAIQIGNDVILDSDGFIIPWGNQSVVPNGVLPWDDRRYYFPIPIKELQLNPNLKQNPGWKGIN